MRGSITDLRERIAQFRSHLKEEELLSNSLKGAAACRRGRGHACGCTKGRCQGVCCVLCARAGDAAINLLPDGVEVDLDGEHDLPSESELSDGERAHR